MSNPTATILFIFNDLLQKICFPISIVHSPSGDDHIRGCWPLPLKPICWRREDLSPNRVPWFLSIWLLELNGLAPERIGNGWKMISNGEQAWWNYNLWCAYYISICRLLIKNCLVRTNADDNTNSFTFYTSKNVNRRWKQTELQISFPSTLHWTNFFAKIPKIPIIF